MRWSYRVTADHLCYDWLARWFAGFPLEGKTPSHTTISDFEKWFMENHADLFFYEVLRQLVAAFPEDDWKTQIGDTFACLIVVLQYAAHGRLRPLSESRDVRILY